MLSTYVPLILQKSCSGSIIQFHNAEEYVHALGENVLDNPLVFHNTQTLLMHLGLIWMINIGIRDNSIHLL